MRKHLLSKHGVKSMLLILIQVDIHGRRLDSCFDRNYRAIISYFLSVFCHGGLEEGSCEYEASRTSQLSALSCRSVWSGHARWSLFLEKCPRFSPPWRNQQGNFCVLRTEHRIAWACGFPGAVFFILRFEQWLAERPIRPDSLLPGCGNLNRVSSRSDGKPVVALSEPSSNVNYLGRVRSQDDSIMCTTL